MRGDFLERIRIRPAVPEDAETIYEIMHRAQRSMSEPSRYITDELPYISQHIQRNGFGLMAEVDGKPVGFFLVNIPGQEEENLGYYLDFTPEQMEKTAIMDSAAVLPEYQGQGVMGRLFQAAVAQTETCYPYLLGTVHPDNIGSRRNFEKNGFLPRKSLVKPGGYQRLLMGRFRNEL